MPNFALHCKIPLCLNDCIQPFFPLFIVFLSRLSVFSWHRFQLTLLTLKNILLVYLVDSVRECARAGRVVPCQLHCGGSTAHIVANWALITLLYILRRNAVAAPPDWALREAPRQQEKPQMHTGCVGDSSVASASVPDYGKRGVQAATLRGQAELARCHAVSRRVTRHR